MPSQLLQAPHVLSGCRVRGSMHADTAPLMSRQWDRASPVAALLSKLSEHRHLSIHCITAATNTARYSATRAAGARYH